MLEKPLGFRLGNQTGFKPNNVSYRPPMVTAAPAFPKAPVVVSALTSPPSGSSGGSFSAGTGGVS